MSLNYKIYSRHCHKETFLWRKMKKKNRFYFLISKVTAKNKLFYFLEYICSFLVDGALSKAISIEIYLLCMEKENHTLTSLKTFSAYLLESKARQFRLCYPRKYHTPGKFWVFSSLIIALLVAAEKMFFLNSNSKCIRWIPTNINKNKQLFTTNGVHQNVQSLL